MNRPEFVADLHVHSQYSRATSRACDLAGLHVWAQRKGVRVVGCGDFTHPEYFKTLEEQLIPTDHGLFRLREDLAASLETQVPSSCRQPVVFMLSGEISSIYKRDGRTRKVHTLVLGPRLESVRALNDKLDRIGNIRSDGRPILGLDPRILVDLVLSVDPDFAVIPAHIWTPWFSMLGSKSGFDSLQACFGEYSQHIFAAETGLSSDIPMNWRCRFLDEVALISNSDLHSPANMARNANLFFGEPDYFEMMAGLRDRDPERFKGTLDMFPEEGKYHHDGHRKCGVSMTPKQTRAWHGLCPKCGSPLVLGVLHRVEELADRAEGERPDRVQSFEYLIPLTEILAELLDCGPKTKKVACAHDDLLRRFGPELHILRHLDPNSLAKADIPMLDEAVRRIRQGRVIRKAGFDGEYGSIKVFEPGEVHRLQAQGGIVLNPKS